MEPSPSAGPLAGGLAAVVGLGVAELLAGAMRTGRSPVVAVADQVIRLGPPSWERAVIDALGTTDKPALIAAVLVVTVVLGIVAGTLPRPAGLALAATVATVGAWAAVVAHDGNGSHAIAPLAGGLVAIATLLLLARAAGTSTMRPLPPPGADRRRFLLAGSTAAVVAATGAAVGRALQGRVDASASRAAVRLPEPTGTTTTSTPAVPATGFDIPGLSTFVTPNDEFYRIDTALIVPQVDTDGWTLTVDGMVEEPLRFTFEELLDRPLVEREVTLACVSNEVGGNLVGNARWLGVPLTELLAEARPKARADQVVGRSVDGFTAGFPLADALDGRTALVAVGMNGEPLPLRHGFPARLVISGLYGYVSATKWLERIELTRFDAYTPYWIERGWSVDGPVKVSARIDRPLRGLTPGTLTVAGVAWATNRGIGKVEVRADDGPWHEATLSAVSGVDTWRQWRWDWRASPGNHVLQVRATTADGERQTEEQQPSFPDGATGWHTVRVKVRA
jgi:DMSO/TMAO reductase YedYZ molybdopterin-dependent catalytic subunit